MIVVIKINYRLQILGKINSLPRHVTVSPLSYDTLQYHTNNNNFLVLYTVGLWPSEPSY